MRIYEIQKKATFESNWEHEEFCQLGWKDAMITLDQLKSKQPDIVLWRTIPYVRKEYDIQVFPGRF